MKNLSEKEEKFLNAISNINPNVPPKCFWTTKDLLLIIFKSLTYHILFFRNQYLDEFIEIENPDYLDILKLIFAIDRDIEKGVGKYIFKGLNYFVSLLTIKQLLFFTRIYIFGLECKLKLKHIPVMNSFNYYFFPNIKGELIYCYRYIINENSPYDLNDCNYLIKGILLKDHEKIEEPSYREEIREYNEKIFFKDKYNERLMLEMLEIDIFVVIGKIFMLWIVFYFYMNKNDLDIFLYLTYILANVALIIQILIIYKERGIRLNKHFFEYFIDIFFGLISNFTYLILLIIGYLFDDRKVMFIIYVNNEIRIFFAIYQYIKYQIIEKENVFFEKLLIYIQTISKILFGVILIYGSISNDMFLNLPYSLDYTLKIIMIVLNIAFTGILFYQKKVKYDYVIISLMLLFLILLFSIKKVIFLLLLGYILIINKILYFYISNLLLGIFSLIGIYYSKKKI